MGGGGLVGAYSPVTKDVCSDLTESPRSLLPRSDADAEHTPSPAAHTQNPTPRGECCCHQTWFTNLMKILPVGAKKLEESTLCSQVSDVAYKKPHPNSWPSKTPPCVIPGQAELGKGPGSSPGTRGSCLSSLKGR